MIRTTLSIVVLVLCATAHAQVTFGVLTGPVFSTAKFSAGIDPEPILRWGLSAGCQLGIPLAPHLALHPELAYRQKGYNDRESEMSFGQEYHYRVTYDYLDFALLFRGYLNKARRGAYLTVGPSIGWFMGSRVRDMEADDYQPLLPMSWQDPPVAAVDPGWLGYNTWDVSVCAGLGLNLPVGTTALGLELRYQHGFSNVHNGFIALDNNGQVISTVNSYNRSFMFNLSWILPVGQAKAKEDVTP